MKIYIKSGLKSLIFSVTFTALFSLKFCNGDPAYALKLIGMAILVFVVPTFIGATLISYLTNLIIKKNTKLKQWHKSGIKSLNVTVPIFILGGAFALLIQLAFTSQYFKQIGAFFIVALLYFVIICAPVGGIVTSISYFKNRK